MSKNTAAFDLMSNLDKHYIGRKFRFPDPENKSVQRVGTLSAVYWGSGDEIRADVEYDVQVQVHKKATINITEMPQWEKSDAQEWLEMDDELMKKLMKKQSMKSEVYRTNRTTVPRQLLEPDVPVYVVVDGAAEIPAECLNTLQGGPFYVEEFSVSHERNIICKITKVIVVKEQQFVKICSIDGTNNISFVSKLSPKDTRKVNVYHSCSIKQCSHKNCQQYIPVTANGKCPQCRSDVKKVDRRAKEITVDMWGGSKIPLSKIKSGTHCFMLKKDKEDPKYYSLSKWSADVIKEEYFVWGWRYGQEGKEEVHRVHFNDIIICPEAFMFVCMKCGSTLQPWTSYCPICHYGKDKNVSFAIFYDDSATGKTNVKYNTNVKPIPEIVRYYGGKATDYKTVDKPTHDIKAGDYLALGPTTNFPLWEIHKINHTALGLLLSYNINMFDEEGGIHSTIVTLDKVFSFYAKDCVKQCQKCNKYYVTQFVEDVESGCPTCKTPNVKERRITYYNEVGIGVVRHLKESQITTDMFCATKKGPYPEVMKICQINTDFKTASVKTHNRLALTKINVSDIVVLYHKDLIQPCVTCRKWIFKEEYGQKQSMCQKCSENSREVLAKPKPNGTFFPYYHSPDQKEPNHLKQEYYQTNIPYRGTSDRDTITTGQLYRSHYQSLLYCKTRHQGYDHVSKIISVSLFEKSLTIKDTDKGMPYRVVLTDIDCVYHEFKVTVCEVCGQYMVIQDKEKICHKCAPNYMSEE